MASFFQNFGVLGLAKSYPVPGVHMGFLRNFYAGNLLLMAILAGCASTEEAQVAEDPVAQEDGAPAAAVESAPVGEWVWVARSDGAKSCGMKDGETLAAAEKQLIKAKIDVRHIRKGTDGQMHIMMCGASQGSTNEAEIHSKDLEKAKKLGWALTPSKR